MEDIDGEQDVVEFWLIEEFMKDIDKSFASGSLKMARDGKTLTFRPWRNLRLIPKAKARRWTGEEDVEKKMAFLRSVHSKPSRTYDIEGNPVHAIYDQYFAGYNGYIGGDVLLEMQYARRFYGEDVLENVERIFTIGKTRDHTPPWAERKTSAGGDHP